MTSRTVAAVAAVAALVVAHRFLAKLSTTCRVFAGTLMVCNLDNGGVRTDHALLPTGREANRLLAWRVFFGTSFLGISTSPGVDTKYEQSPLLTKHNCTWRCVHQKPLLHVVLSRRQPMHLHSPCHLLAYNNDHTFDQSCYIAIL